MNDFERWIYVLKNMETFDRMPNAAQKAVFDKLGSVAEITAMPKKEREMFEESLKVYRDNLAIAAYQFKSGRKEVRKEEARTIALRVLHSGMDIDTVASMTGLTENEVSLLTEN